MNTATLASPKQRKAKVSQVINVRRITNPFEPLRSVETEQWVWKKRKLLSTYLPVGLSADHVVSRNGAVIEQKDLSKTFLNPNDYVVICPIPRAGGGGGKGILRIVAMIAVAVASVYTGGAAAAAYGGVGTVAGAAAGAAAAAAVTIAGSLLVNAILPPVTATNQGGNTLANSASYGADGAKNTSDEGIAVPVSYGDYRYGGNIIGLYTEQNVSDTAASNNGNNQILYMLINAGEGPIASISDILINDRPVNEYADVTIQTRLGYGVQSPIDWFSKVISPVNKNVLMPPDGSFITVSTVEECEQFRIDFACPNGLYSLNTKDGSFSDNSVALDIDYRVLGSGAPWSSMSATTTNYSNIIVTPTMTSGQAQGGGDHNDSTPSVPIVIGFTFTNTDGSPASADDSALALAQFAPNIGQPWPYDTVTDYQTTVGTPATFTVPHTVPTGDMVIKDNLRATVRRSFTSPQIPMAKYEIRVKRNTGYTVQTVNNNSNQINTVFPTDTADTSQSQTYLTDLNEITFDGVAYNHTALLALRIQMDDQLSGVPSVSFMRGGNLVTVLTRTAGVILRSKLPSKNPAWCWFDMATNPIYGAGLDESRLDIDSILAWAAMCDANGLTWNGPFDQIQNFWDASALMLRVGHAQVIQVGTRYYVATEAEADPVMMFGMGNIVQDSFKITWLGQKDRATEIDVTYFDKTDGNKSKTVKVTDSSLALTGAGQNVSAITLFGIDDIKTAYQEGAFQLNLNRLLTKSIEFEAPLEAIACTPGDVALVQHNMPKWAYSGRLEKGSTTTSLVLDQSVTMEAGKAYKALVLTNFVMRAQAIVLSITNNFVKLAGGVNINNRINRIRGSNGFETAITTMVPDGVYVDDATGFIVGDDASLFDTDVVTDVDVVLQVGDTTTLALATPISYAPDQFTNFMFGEATSVRKPFRITAVTLATNTANRNIKALEYNPEVYDLSAYADVFDTLTPPFLPPEQAAIGQVIGLSLYEETYVSGTQILSDMRAAWGGPQVGSYAGADVYVSVNGGPLTLYDTVRAATSYVVPGTAAGQQITVKVVAYDLWGKRSSYDNAPTASSTVIGSIGSIDVANVSGANFIWGGKDCKIFWNYNAVTSSFEFGSEPNGADSGTRDPHFQDYEVRVYDHAHTLLRTEHTTDNSYIYTFEKNVADGTHRRLTFEIAVRDIFNNIGAPAVLDAYNPPPQVTSVVDNVTYDRAQVNFQHTDDTDYAGAQVFLRQGGDVDLVHDTPAYDGPDVQVLLTNLMFNADYNFVIVPYDAFGLDETIPSQQFHFHTPFLDVEAIAEGVLKDSQLIPALQTRINLIDGDIDMPGSVASRVYSEQTSRTDADTALGSRIDVVAAKSNDNFAAILTETDARAAADSATASQITTLQTTVGGHTAAIQQDATTINGLNAQYTVKIDNNGFVSGFGLASFPVNGGIVSEFAVRADTFSVQLPGFSGVHPFTIGAVNGVPQVIISSALIGDASIGTAKIGDLAVNTLKLAGNSVTIPAYMSGNGGSGDVYAGQVSDIIGSITVNYPDVSSVVVLMSWQSGVGPDSTDSRIQISVDGDYFVDVGNSSQQGFTSSFTTSARVTLAPGNHTFAFRAANEWVRGYWNIGIWSCLILGVMR